MNKILFLIIGLIIIGGVFWFASQKAPFKKPNMPEQAVSPQAQPSPIAEPEVAEKTAKKVLMIVAGRDFKDEEYFKSREVLERAGFVFQVASDIPGTAYGVDGGQASVDLTLDEVRVGDYDAIVFIGGPGALKHLDNETSYKIVQEAVSQDKILAAICIAPSILAKAQVLSGKKATVWTSPLDKSAKKVLEENGAIFIDQFVVQDGKIITGNGPAAAQEFAETIVKAF